LGALDRVMHDLPSAVNNADLVLLALPVDQIRSTLEMIRQDLRQGTVVMDTGPAKETVASWATELLPPERYYIGLTPVINPIYLHEIDSGVSAARPDLFRGGLIGIIAPPGVTSEAIKQAADLTRLLGATPLFSDPLEMDGLVAATHILPQLMAAGLLNATIDQPGWQEGRKIAGRSYAEATAAILHATEAKTLTDAALLNRDNVLRVIEGVIASLQAIRHDLQNQDAEMLEERLTRARRGREVWLKTRMEAEWVSKETPTAEAPPTSGLFGRLIGFDKRRKK
jgi:prephenate dehydrogenase